MPYYGKYRGIVTENDDPQKQGRLKIKVPRLFGDEELEWAYPCVQYAPDKMGFYFIPKKDDLVWVEFEAGEVCCPIWSGMWWKTEGIPIEATIDNCILKTSSGHLMEFNAKENEILFKITDSTGQKLEINSSKQFISLRDVSGQNLTIDSKNQIIQLSNMSGEEGVTDVSTKTMESTTTAVTGTYKSYNDTALSMEAYMNMSIPDFLSDYGTQYVSALEDEFTTLFSNITSECEGLLTQFIDGVKEDVLATYSGVIENFESFYNSELLPKVTNGEFIDPAYLGLVVQGVDGIKSDIESIQNSLTASLDSVLNEGINFFQSEMSSKLESFLSDNWGSYANACEGLLHDVKTDFSQSITSMGSGKASEIVSNTDTLKQEKPIYNVSGQNIIIDSKNKFTEILHADGLKFKMDSNSKEIFIIDAYGHKIEMNSSGINLRANGGVINLG